MGDQSEVENPVVIAKFFDPVGSASWYATEYDAETNICYGYVTGLAYDEWGTFSLTILESIKRPLDLSIERDLYFKEIGIDELIQQSRLAELPKDREQDKDKDAER